MLILTGVLIITVLTYRFTRCFYVAEYCKDGEWRDDTGSCVPCPRGYYKNNTEYEFGPCTLCPIAYITLHEGAQSEANCTISKLTIHQHPVVMIIIKRLFLMDLLLMVEITV